MGKRAKGLAKVIEDERPTAAPPVEPPVQLVLGAALGVPLVGSAGPIALAPDDAEDGGELVQGDRRVGRPPGARNKSTEAWRRFVLGIGGSPLQALARVYGADPRELAAYLGCKPVEALEKILQAARVALPYLHSPMPTDVRIEGKGAMAFGVFMARPGDGRGDAQLDHADPLAALEHFASLPPGSLEVRDGEIIENQEVSATVDGQSNGSESNAAPKSEAGQ